MPSIKTAIVGWSLSAASFHAPILAALPDFEIAAVLSPRPDTVDGEGRAAPFVDPALEGTS